MASARRCLGRTGPGRGDHLGCRRLVVLVVLAMPVPSGSGLEPDIMARRACTGTATGALTLRSLYSNRD